MLLHLLTEPADTSWVFSLCVEFPSAAEAWAKSAVVEALDLDSALSGCAHSPLTGEHSTLTLS